MLNRLITKVIGSKSEREIKKLAPEVDRINEIFAGLSDLADEELRGKTDEFRARLAAGETPDDLMHEAFAVVKEACRRLVGQSWPVVGHETSWAMVPFDVQLMGAVVLHRGEIAEMATGEGKTLVATMPLYLNALTGEGAHLATVNEYLAERDSEWVGRVFQFLGLTVGLVRSGMTPEERREAYAADVTYGTNTEFGFDYLRDNMAVRLEDMVQRGHHYAIVDEVDSLLIDEARTPLIISGAVERSTEAFDALRDPVKKLVTLQASLVSRLVKRARELLAEDPMSEEGLMLLLKAKRGAPKSPELLRLLEDPEVAERMQKLEAQLRAARAHLDLGTGLYYEVDETSRSVVLEEEGRRALAMAYWRGRGELPKDLVEWSHDFREDQRRWLARRERVQQARMEKAAEAAPALQKPAGARDAVTEGPDAEPTAEYDARPADAELRARAAEAGPEATKEVGGPEQQFAEIDETKDLGSEESERRKEEIRREKLLERLEVKLFDTDELAGRLAEIDAMVDLDSKESEDRKFEVYRLHEEKLERIRNIHALLKAHVLFEKGVDYTVEEVEEDGRTKQRVVIIDEFTGRLMPGRRWSDGLHQAVEAKEGVEVGKEMQTLATITLQNYFRRYDKLAGMSGTAETEEDEFLGVYELPVKVVPTNEPVRRVDYDDVILKTWREKGGAVVREVERLNARGQPVLVGARSVEESRNLSRLLKRKGIENTVLNALLQKDKYAEQKFEAQVVMQAGQLGAVTIATNMAGRGTDIKLGPGVVKCERCCLLCETKDCASCPNEYDRSEECLGDVPCGLRIVGTERHEARRIDRQLRGRSGRQGDPGASQFFVSLEDDLMRLFGSERIARVMTTLGVKEGEVIQHPMVTRAIERAQKRVEGQNFEIRKHLLEYDDVMNQQREVIYAQRLNILRGGDLQEEIEEIFGDIIGRFVDARTASSEIQEKWDLDGLRDDMRRVFMVDIDFSKADVRDIRQEALRENLMKAARLAYDRREERLGSEVMRWFERFVFLQMIDKNWRDHLYELDRLKEGIGLRAYGQKNPLLEYKSEAFDMFMGAIESIQEESVSFLFRAQEELVLRLFEAQAGQAPVPTGRAVHADARGASEAAMKPAVSATAPPEFGAPSTSGGGAAEGPAAREPDHAPRGQAVRKGKKVGRNDPCPCGSGKKYKKCCGRNA